MKRSLFLIILVLSIFFNLIAEEGYEAGEPVFEDFPQQLDFSRIEPSSDDDGEIIIETDLPKTQVYLNNTFYGYTKLKIKNLLAGQYILRLSKPGCKSASYLIEVRKNYRLTYKVKMEKQENSELKGASNQESSMESSTEGIFLQENSAS